jgi:predicted DNA-binding protein YlxM (UPF0122 family)
MRTLTLKQLATEIERDTALGRRISRAVSPGGVASDASVSRQAIHQAIQRGTLEAFRIEDHRGNLCAILIPDDAIKAYFARRSTAA